MERLIPLYAYWLRAPMLNDKIVYAGCAKDVELRRKAAQRRYNMTLTVTKSKPYYDYDAAGARETAEITKHWLTLFNVVRKSAVSKHYPEKCAKTSSALKGQAKSPEHCASISRSRTGKKFGPHSAETNRRIGLGNKGKTVSQETRDLLSSINLGKKQSAETIAKRVAKNTGKKRTPEQVAVLKAALLAAHAAKRAAGTNKQTAEHIRHRLESKARNSEERMLLQSGYGHPWRIKDLDKATQEMIA